MMNPLRISPISVFRVWQRNATVYRHTFLYNIVPNFFEPFLYLLGMGIGLGAYISGIEGISYLQYISPGLLATSAMMGASFEVTYNVYVKMHFGKTYDGMITTPVCIEDIAVGEMFWAASRSFIYGGAFFIVLILFGLVNSIESVLVLGVIVLIGLMFAGIGLTFTALVKDINLYNFYFTLFITPLFLFSGIFFPVHTLPGWIQSVAWYTPLYHAVNLCRTIQLGSATDPVWEELLWMILVSLAFFVSSVILMRRRVLKGRG